MPLRLTNYVRMSNRNGLLRTELENLTRVPQRCYGV